MTTISCTFPPSSLLFHFLRMKRTNQSGIGLRSSSPWINETGSKRNINCHRRSGKRNSRTFPLTMMMVQQLVNDGKVNWMCDKMCHFYECFELSLLCRREGAVMQDPLKTRSSASYSHPFRTLWKPFAAKGTCSMSLPHRPTPKEKWHRNRIQLFPLPKSDQE